MLNALLSLAVTYDANQMLIGLVVGVIVLIVLVTMTKVPAFVAIILAAMLVALVGGVPGGTIPGMISGGFGGTLGTIGIIIGFGVIMGQIFEVSGAAERMARTFIKLFGKGREELALALTGFIVSIPIFCDSAFVILFPIAKAISKKTRKNLVMLAGALAMGLVITHTMVPPTPGPLAVGASFGVEIGTLILWGLIVAIPMTIAGLFYIKWVSKSINIVPNEQGELVRLEVSGTTVFDFDINEAPTKKLPGTFLSFAPILVPIILIVLNQVLKTAITGFGSTWIGGAFAFIGSPIPAVAVGVVIAIYGLGFGMQKEEALKHMDAGVRQAGIILLVTGAGGSLGRVIQETGVGNTIANAIVGWGIPLIILPFFVATIVRFIQGSGTVSLVTSASITAPILLAAGANPVFGALAAMVGGVFFGYFNDSYFHVVNRSIGITVPKEQLKFWSGATTAAWAAGFVTILILNAILGGVVGV
jgi:gluconate:H+ symporter, GntP family